MLPRIGLTTSPSVLEGRAVEALDRDYVVAIAAAGAVPSLLPVLEPHLAPQAVAGLDGIVLTGGGDVDPALYGSVPSPHLGTVDAGRDAWEIALVRAAVARGLPLLGICRGAQVLNVALGGTLVQHLPDSSDLRHCQRDRCRVPVHDVRVERGSRLRTVMGADVVGVNSLHHQAVARVADGLAAVAWAEDGAVEAVEGLGPARLLGVQWHPELLATGRHSALFEWLLAEAAHVQPVPVPAALPAVAPAPVPATAAA